MKYLFLSELLSFGSLKPNLFLTRQDSKNTQSNSVEVHGLIVDWQGQGLLVFEPWLLALENPNVLDRALGF
ncbi:hypothetical protein [Mongoliitalea lutea]|uniref:Uncharacterized protein n=1 Tax=Mongoliitalea lutea TaxID=849756 RepID=A0A8J3G6S5_9BACT|nr:hypothetical protein [Mongoliitalea lutea]GHB47404.1 hypothetical protein GCM10008106_30450 [Mongoliitalea lutea]